MSFIYRTYIITVGNLTAAKAKLEAKGQDGRLLCPGLPGHFTTALSGNGNLPATRYISSGLLSPSEVAYLDAELPRSIDVSDGTRTVNVDGVTTTVLEGPHEFIARLGLKLVAGTTL